MIENQGIEVKFYSDGPDVLDLQDEDLILVFSNKINFAAFYPRYPIHRTKNKVVWQMRTDKNMTILLDSKVLKRI